jgi:hypothetical protein
MRCLAQDTRLESIEQLDRAGLERLRAHAAWTRAEELMDKVPVHQTMCLVCGERLATSRGVLFQDDQLVHAACWRGDVKTVDEPPAE